MANARMPSQRAQSLQVLQCAAAFQGHGVRTTLVHARRAGDQPTTADELCAHYGVREDCPSIQAVHCIDWIDRVPESLQFWPARLQEWSFVRSAVALAKQCPEAWVYTREVEVAAALEGRGRVALELHRVPGGRLRRRALLASGRARVPLVAISGGVREDVLRLGYPEALVFVEHDGFEASRFSEAEAPEMARLALGIDLARPVVGYFGGLLEWKGVDLLVEAARDLPEVQFVIAGGMDRDVERLRQRAGGLPNVRLDGFQPPTLAARYLAAFDVTVAPNRSTPAISARYTSPLKVFEAMAAGVPLVVSDLPSMREVLDEQTAVFFEPDSAIALSRALQALLVDSDRRRSMASALRARSPLHTWAARAGRILDRLGVSA